MPNPAENPASPESQVLSDIGDLGESPAVSPDDQSVSQASAEETPFVEETQVSETPTATQPPAETLSGFIQSAGLEESRAIALLKEVQQFTTPEGQQRYNQHLQNILNQQIEVAKPKIFQEYLGAALKTPEGIQALEGMLRRVKGEPETSHEPDLEDVDENTAKAFKQVLAKVQRIEADNQKLREELRQAPAITKQQFAQERMLAERQAKELDAWVTANPASGRYQEVLGEDILEAIQGPDGARFRQPGAVAQEAARLVAKYERLNKSSGGPQRVVPKPAPRGSAQGVAPPQPRKPQNEDELIRGILETIDSTGRG